MESEYASNFKRIFATDTIRKSFRDKVGLFCLFQEYLLLYIQIGFFGLWYWTIVKRFGQLAPYIVHFSRCNTGWTGEYERTNTSRYQLLLAIMCRRIKSLKIVETKWTRAIYLLERSCKETLSLQSGMIDDWKSREVQFIEALLQYAFVS